jgi:Collagenase NC10 and Endostatin
MGEEEMFTTPGKLSSDPAR